MALHAKAEGYSIGAVVSNKPEAAGLAWAQEHSIPTHTLMRESYPSLAEFKRGILAKVIETGPDFVALAGFMMVLQPEFIEVFPGRVINIHPSLLPKYPGLDTHARAIEAKESLHGCTVHFVDSGIDTGTIIAQAVVPVEPGETPEKLAERTLHQEHTIYPWVMRHLAKGNIRLEATKVRYSDEVRKEALARNYRLHE